MGTVTVGVSLPRTWTRARGLVAGNSVRLWTLPNGEILVRDGRESDQSIRTVFSVLPNESSEHLFRRLIGAYVNGAAEIVVEQQGGITAETRQIVRAFSRRTAQTEIVSDEGELLRLREVSRGAGLSVRLLLRRMFQVVRDLHLDAGRTWSDSRASSPETHRSRDDEVDRYAWLIERILALQLAGGPGEGDPDAPLEDSLQSLLLARALERVADHAVNLAELGTRLRDESLPESALKALTDYHDQVMEILTAAYAVAETPDSSRANEVIDMAEALHSTHATLSERFLSRGTYAELPPMAIAAIGLTLQSIDRTTAYAEDIAQVGLDRAARGESAPPMGAASGTRPFSRSSDTTLRGGTGKR